MLALHALWRADHRLALWAEDSRSPAQQPVMRPTRTARPHPYACSPEAVAELLGGTGTALDWLVSKTTAGQTTLLMPSRSGVPLPSPELGGAATGPQRAAELVPW